MWGYSRFGPSPLVTELFDAAVKVFEPQIQQAEVQTLSVMMLAAATLEHQLPASFLDAVARQAVLKMPQATQQGASNLLWSFAKLSNVSPLGGDLFRSALGRNMEVLSNVPDHIVQEY